MTDIQKCTNNLFEGVKHLIQKAQHKTAVFVNREASLLYWSIGNFINLEIRKKQLDKYGSGILVTLSQQLTLNFGKGYNYSALTRMCKVAAVFKQENIATLSQQLTWSHLIELASIDDDLKRQFYGQLAFQQHWGVRELRKQIDTMLFERTALAAKPENVIKQQINDLTEQKVFTPDLIFKNTYILDFLNLPKKFTENDLESALISNMQNFILELGDGFSFVERQKRIMVDSIDYHLDLLFFHRKLKRLIAIDLKLGKFIPEYKAKMELYLRWLQKYEKQGWEEDPLGLLLCSEGNTEHIELLMLDTDQIKVAQYLTEFPAKEWFADKLHRAIEITRQNLLNANEKE